MLRAACDNYHLYPCPSMGPFNPYQIEGPKTMSYEIVEQSGWTVPDWVFVPAGGGSGIGGNWKGYEDFTQLGFINSVPKMVVVQSTGCAPIVRAYERNMDPLRIVPWDRPDSVATGLMDPYPMDQCGTTRHKEITRFKPLRFQTRKFYTHNSNWPNMRAYLLNPPELHRLLEP